jgi:phosphatidylglycerophosphate synthase
MDLSKGRYSYMDYINLEFYKLSDKISNIIVKNNIPITPNMVTIFAFLLSMSLIYFTIYKQQYHIAAIIYFISRYLDTLDGALARKTNTSSKLGEQLDHYCDILSGFILAYIIYYHRANKSPLFFIVPLVLLVLELISISCQERWINKHNKGTNDTIQFLGNYCPDCEYENPLISKTFGYGFMSIMISIYLWNMDKF